ncbi:MAG TPA: Hsp70 family protein, partial [Candidatus Eisenbacteria bacterium]|nr:Hsp70 family protein [Candidatus Eisenbacteria bacterium]
GGLTEQEIQKMVRDAESHADEDKTRREEVETKNRADALVWETEKQMKDLGDKVDPESRAKVESATDALKKAIERGGVDGIKSASEELTKVWNEVSSKLYAEAAKAGGAGGPGMGGPGGPEMGGPGGPAGESPKGKKGGEDGAVDADYEVVK